MYRVLIVSEDLALRQNLIHAIYKEAGGFQLAGEARHGMEAMDLLQCRKVELALIDLSRPATALSGMALLKEIYQAFAHVRVVVLSRREDMKTAVSSMRLGAIDYVVMKGFQRDVLLDMLHRAARRLSRERSSQEYLVASLPAPGVAPLRPIHGLLICPTSPDEEASSFGLLMNNDRLPWQRITDTCWYAEVPDAADTEERLLEWVTSADSGKFIAYRIVNDGNYAHETVVSLLRHFATHDMFYDYASWTKTPCCSLVNVRKRQTAANASRSLTDLWNQWALCAWVLDDCSFEALMREVKRRRHPKEQLLCRMQHTLQVWTTWIRAEAEEHVRVLTDNIYFWEEMENNLRYWRSVCQQTIHWHHISNEVFTCILKALIKMEEGLAMGITQGQVADHVSLSRGYFSKIFKRVTGSSFHQTMRTLQMGKAKQLLAGKSKLPIYAIAESIGFRDEKYFSKMFRQETGLLPSEYRKDALDKMGAFLC
ncbi:helix-turn-helix domain-containing protein [Paenibacillus sp. IB182496]|uniref:Helix-turn-helix domain-containing protein n=1 Tax=Paenibacillus sabuli TaxID=2772509 RepID=A0A927GQR8_9BACL|nr:helix-turn-helix domain-containing protein [Paenibacillus sabuli]MBD2844052.1 helix-turn-helix domain-containing protein [Paenibacillus sabuli]